MEYVKTLGSYDKYFYWNIGVKSRRLIRKMSAIGYEYDFINSEKGMQWFNYDGGHITFNSWQAVKDWLNGVVID